ncbi:MAG: hypothetical protein QW701_02925 [Candidatus Nezhaarchaeales archaeon]
MTGKALGVSQVLTSLTLVMALCSLGITLYITPIKMNASSLNSTSTTSLRIEAYMLRDDVLTVYIRNLGEKETIIVDAYIDKPYGGEATFLEVLEPRLAVIAPKSVKPLSLVLPKGLNGIHVVTLIGYNGEQATCIVEL